MRTYDLYVHTGLRRRKTYIHVPQRTGCIAQGENLRSVTGASRIQREVDEGRRDPLDALDALWELEAARLASMPAEERRAVVQRGQSPWSVRAAVRRMLEHGWEHYSEIAQRLGKPVYAPAGACAPGSLAEARRWTREARARAPGTPALPTLTQTLRHPTRHAPRSCYL